MALKNIKILREIIPTCTKIIGKQELSPFSTKLPTSLATSHNDHAQPEHVETLTATPIRKQAITRLIFKDNVNNEDCVELQPQTLVKFIETPSGNTKYITNPSPFPDFIRPLRRPTSRMSDMDKAEQKLAEARVFKNIHFKSFHSGIRQFSSSSSAHKRSSDNGDLKRKSEKYGKDCSKPRSKCGIVKKRKQCYKSDCPSHKLKDCPEARKPPECNHYYQDAICSKVMAPYPAYSESCVEYMPEDPSECVQCPWRRCDNADSIKPPPRRKYHTEARTSLAGPNCISLMPDFSEVNSVMDCDAKKKPCPPPPDKCEERRKLEESLRKKKEEAKKKQRKAMNVDNWANAWGLFERKPVANVENLNPYTLLPMTEPILPESTDTLVLSGGCKTGKKPPNCKRNIKPVKDNREMSIWAKDKKKPKKKKDKKPLKGDEGMPPPCEEDYTDSLQCPEKPIKKPKYRKRPLHGSFHKKPEDPYTPTE